jgi:hypothetical protein
MMLRYDLATAVLLLSTLLMSTIDRTAAQPLQVIDPAWAILNQAA